MVCKSDTALTSDHLVTVFTRRSQVTSSNNGDSVFMLMLSVGYHVTTGVQLLAVLRLLGGSSYVALG
jgi:hypothetical protein